MTPEMTKHYQAHANRKDKEKYLKMIPEFLSAATVPCLPFTQSLEKKEAIIRSLDRLTDDQLQSVEDHIKRLLGD